MEWFLEVLEKVLRGFFCGGFRDLGEVSGRFWKSFREVLERVFNSLARSLRGLLKGFGIFERSWRGFGEVSRCLGEVLERLSEVLDMFWKVFSSLERSLRGLLRGFQKPGALCVFL